MNIRLDKGENPVGAFMAYCPRCGGDSGLVLTGDRKYKTECPHCGTMNFGSRPTEPCGKCKKLMIGGKKKPIKDNERMPGPLCHECEKELQEFQRIVSIGGVFWKCKECGQHGVINPGPFADDVRAKGAKGVEFTYCTEHTVKDKEQNETNKSKDV